MAAGGQNNSQSGAGNDAGEADFVSDADEVGERTHCAGSYSLDMRRSMNWMARQMNG